MSSLEKSLNEVMTATSCTYRGARIEVEGTMYRVFGNTYNSLRGATVAIDGAYGSLGNSIEQWVEVKGYEGLYSVSNMGQVKSIPHIVKSKNRFGAYGVVVKGGLLASAKRGHYLAVTLSGNGTQRGRMYSIHRLVAEAFIPNPQNKPQVNHIDGNKLNNRRSNLEWSTRSENCKHAVKLGLIKYSRGEANHNSIYTDKQRQEVAEHYTKGVRQYEIVKLTGVGRTTVNAICRGVDKLRGSVSSLGDKIGKPVVAVDGNSVQQFPSLTKCAKHMGCSVASIGAAIKQGFTVSGKYKIKYADGLLDINGVL